MSLKIYLLGQFKLQANDLPIELPSRPAQSLLAYLVLNAGVTHRRETLASLLWPEATETNARSYLRQALWRIRKSLLSGSLSWEDYLQISDISVAFDDHSDYWLDADLLLKTTEALPVEEMIESIRLYRGELLPGFYEEWIVLERDRLQTAFQQKMNLLLERLIQAEQWDQALNWGEQWIRLGYSPEPAFRALMKAHAGLGDQAMVSATYQRCVESLNRELSLEPSPETQRLYEQLLRGKPHRFVSPPTHVEDLPPSFLDEGEAQQIEKPVFVARQRELAQLDGLLDLVQTGQGRVVFVTGEAGSGKTALIQEFTYRAQDTHPDLIVASGNCNAHTGIGDPYLPFREVLELLTGDVEARWAAGAITQEHAIRLWNTLPLTAQALVEVGPDLIDTFVPGKALFERAITSTPGRVDWLTRLDEIIDLKAGVPFNQSLKQSDFFEQYTRVLQTLANKVALVVVLDDLQWADLGSINLLFHLGRQLAGHRILIMGVYRPEEVAIGRDGERHPLEPVVSELQREFGDVMVDMDQAESQEFLDALLDSEPNQLRSPFRQMIYQQTHGQPLFTIELLRGMQERGELIQDQEGRWIEGAALDWDTLPARVEAVVAERIARLDPPLRAALRVASVEGEVFTAEVVSQIQAIDDREILVYLSRELDRRHRLVHAQSILRMDGQLLSSYRFQHSLFQRYLYSSLDEVERVHLHEQVGNALEELYGVQEQRTFGADIATQLARHFQEARIPDKAIQYLYQAGERAVQLSAYQDGLVHLTKGVELLTSLPETPARAQQELDLHITLGKAWSGTKGYGLEVKQAYTRARELCQQLGETSQLSRVLGELAVFYYVQAEHQKALELAEEALSLAQEAGDPLLIAISHWYLGYINFAHGEYLTAREHLSKMLSFYEPHKHHYPLVSLRGSDAGMSALAYDACCLWCLGYLDQALNRSREVLAYAREFDHLFSLVDVLCYAGCMLHAMRRDGQALKRDSLELMRLSHDAGFAGWIETGTAYYGESLVFIGRVSEGLHEIRENIAANESLGGWLYLPGALRALAEAQSEAGQPEAALATLAEALEVVDRTSEHHWEAELHRQRAEVMLLLGVEDGAEASYQTAIEIACQQSARSWELRAAIGLARLLLKQGKSEGACQVLQPVYDWFTEGFETQDLKEAKALLQEISNSR
jgi:DNA-binding SARP family transcriptional activator/predicted ATPase